jgi:ParB family chromosome partitioning protein
MAKKFNLEGMKDKIKSDRTLTSEEEARESFWTPSSQNTDDLNLQNNKYDEFKQSVHNLDLSQIMPDPDQPRKYFDKNALEDLTNSIRERGVESPIIVRPIPEGKFKIIAGERRWRCSLGLGLKTIPAIIKEVNDAEAYMLSLTENIQRESLHYLDESAAFKRMVDAGYVKDQRELTEKLGKSKGYISEKFKILSLPQKVKEIIYASDAITFSHAVLLAQLQNTDASYELAQRIAKGEMSVRKLESFISSGAVDKPNKIRHKASFQPVQIRKVSNGFNLTVKYRKDRPEDVIKIINIFEQHINELKRTLEKSELDESSHV